MIKHKQFVSSKAGLPPGSAIYIGDAPPSTTHISMHIYNQETYECVTGFDHLIIEQALKDGFKVWIDIYGLADTARISSVCEYLHIHSLVAEDIVNTKQRPKLDFFDDYLFIVFRLLDSPTTQLEFSYEQISLLMKKNILLTIRETNDYHLSPIYKQLSAKLSFIRSHDISYLLYSVMDDLIDKYFQFVEESTKMIEKMEDISINNPEKISPKAIYLIKRRIIHLRKVIAPLRDIIHSLLKDAGHFIEKHDFVYYRDLYDHTARLIESLNFHHDLTSETLNIYVSIVNTRMNQTMKVLTVFASLFIPLNFIVGIFGMNFASMPILQWAKGFHIVLASMFILVVVMLYYFKRKKLY